MITMFCATCQMDVFIAYTEYREVGAGFRMVYHLQCENLHKITVEGELYIMKPDSAEQRIIQYLIQQSEQRYGEHTSN